MIITVIPGRHARDFAYQALPFFIMQHLKIGNIGPGDEASSDIYCLVFAVRACIHVVYSIYICHVYRC